MLASLVLAGGLLKDSENRVIFMTTENNISIHIIVASTLHSVGKLIAFMAVQLPPDFFRREFTKKVGVERLYLS